VVSVARAISNGDPFADVDATLARVYAALRIGKPYPRLSEREQVKLLDELEPANRNALLHAVTLMRDEGSLTKDKLTDIARRHRADGWCVLCGLGYIPPWGRAPPQQRIALQLAGQLFQSIRC
jgi:hypothetical protein